MGDFSSASATKEVFLRYLDTLFSPVLHCERLKNAVFFDPLRYPNKLDLSIGNVFIHRGGHPNDTTLLAALALGGAALSVKKPTQNHNLMRLPVLPGHCGSPRKSAGTDAALLPAVSANPRSRGRK